MLLLYLILEFTVMIFLQKGAGKLVGNILAGILPGISRVIILYAT